MTDISFLKDFIVLSNYFKDEEMEVSIKAYNYGTTDLYNCKNSFRIHFSFYGSSIPRKSTYDYLYLTFDKESDIITILKEKSTDSIGFDTISNKIIVKTKFEDDIKNYDLTHLVLKYGRDITNSNIFEQNEKNCLESIDMIKASKLFSSLFAS
mgnify:CR=1 FL=1